MLMAMSYSYNLQAQIFDAWEAAKAALVKAKALLDKFLKKFFTTSAPPGKLISHRKKSICHAVQIRFDYLREGLVELR